MANRRTSVGVKGRILYTVQPDTAKVLGSYQLHQSIYLGGFRGT